MSLILRKECQEVLNSVGLKDHHVSVDKNRYLSVNCECGSPLFKVLGIVFTRTAPSKDEITYAAELFKEYINKHKVTIQKFLKEQAKFNALPEVEVPKSITQVGNLRYRYSLTEDVYFTFTLGVDRTVTDINNFAGVTTDNVTKVKFSRKRFDTDVVALGTYLQYQEDSSSFNNIQGLMDSCEV